MNLEEIILLLSIICTPRGILFAVIKEKEIIIKKVENIYLQFIRIINQPCKSSFVNASGSVFPNC